MALDVKTYERVANDNDAASPFGAPENMSPRDVNNVIRQIMAVAAQEFDRSTPANTTAGTGAAYTLTSANHSSAPVEGDMYCMRVHMANTVVAPTLSVNNSTAIFMLNNSADTLPIGGLKENSAHLVYYDGTQFRVMTLGFSAETLTHYDVLSLDNGSYSLTLSNTGVIEAVGPGDTVALRVTANGDVIANGNVTSESDSIASDTRDKQDIERFEDDDAATLLGLLNPITFRRKGKPFEEFGFAAQEVAAADKRLTHPFPKVGTSEWRIGVRPSGILAVAVGAIRALEKRVAELERANNQQH